MADPLSIASGVAGLLSLTGAIISEGYRISSRIKQNSDNIRSLLNELSLFSGVLAGLKAHLTEQSNSVNGKTNIANSFLLSQPYLKAISECTDILQKTLTLLGKLGKLHPVMRAIQWDSILDEAQELVSKLERYKSMFILCFQVDQSFRKDEVRAVEREIIAQLTAIKSEQDRVERQADIQRKLKKCSKVIRWLGEVPRAKHDDTTSLRHEQSGLWLLNNPIFTNWVSATSSSFLWLNGIPGSGKTVLVSTVINHLENIYKSDTKVGIAYYYCDFARDQNLTLAKLVGSLLSQLIRQDTDSQFVESNMFELFDEHEAMSSYPTASELECYFLRLAETFSNTIIIIDALDEITDRDDIVHFLISLSGADGCIKLFIASRNEPDLEDAFPHFNNIAIGSSDIESDVEQYIRSRISRSRWKGSPESEEIVQTLKQRADGMFFWVACQLDQLCRVRTRIGLDMLRSLPRGLECTYQRILSKVHESDKLHAYRILRFVMFASRSLDLSELVEAIALEENSLSLEDVESRKLCRPDDIFEICGSLIRYSESTGSIRLAHHSIREFLGSPMAGSGVPNEYFISETESYVLLAKTCVTYLNLNDFSSNEFPTYHEGEKHDLAKEKIPPEGDISDHSFLEYAALNCLSHLAQLEAETLEILWPLLRKLFDLRRGNFLYWTSVLRYRHGEFKYPRSIKPLHVCVIHDLEDIAARLISEGHSCNDETIDGRTALHIALENGNNATAELLVANGAAVDAISIGGRRPLHLAIESGNERAVSVLVRAGADVNARLPNGDFPLSIAIENNWHVLVSIFLTKADTTLRLADGRSVLHLAAEVGSEIITRKLLDHGLKPNEKDENGWTPLHFSAHYGNSEVTKVLFLRDADGPTGDKNGWTPLHSAIYRRKLDCAAILLTASLYRTRRRRRPMDPIPSRGLNADSLNRNISPLQPSGLNDRAGDTMMHPALSSSSGALFDSQNSSEGRRVEVDGRYTFTRHPPRQISSTGGLGSSVNAAPSRSNLELDSDNSPEPFNAGSPRPRLTVGGKYSLDARQEPRTPRRRVSILRAGVDSSARSEIGNIRMPTPLFLAVSDNFIAGVKLLLENSPDLSDIIECIDVALLQTEFSILELLLGKSGVDNIRYCLKKVGGNGLERARLLCLRALHKRSNDKNPFTAAVKSQDNKILSLLLQEQLPEEISCLRSGCPETVFGGNTQAIELLAEYGVDISIQDSREQTALHRAVIDRNDAAVKFLVDIGINATIQDENGYTALYWAVEKDNVYATRLLCNYEKSSLPVVKKGVSKTTLQLAVEYRNREVAQVLLERGVTPAALDVAKMNTLLHWIIESRNQVLLEILLSHGADVAATNEVGKTALQLASEHGNEEAARVLLTRGATVGAMDKVNANNLLHWMVKSDDRALVKLLLEQGVDIETTNEAGQTALQLAIASENVEIMVMLLKERAKVVETNEVGKTILRLALKKQSLELVRLLLEKGQEIEVGDELGKSILELAIRKGNVALVELILKNGGSAGGADEVGKAILSLAVEIGDVAQVQLLLNAGVKPTAKTSTGGQTTLYIALKSRNESLVALLLRHGADVVAADGLGKTALHWAATFGGEAIVLMLLNRGADIKAIDNEGMTPVQIARQRGLSNIAELLAKWERNHKAG